MNWGGPAYDPSRQLMIVNVNTVPQVVILVPRKDIRRASRASRLGSGKGCRRADRHSVWRTSRVVAVAVGSALHGTALG